MYYVLNMNTSKILVVTKNKRTTGSLNIEEYCKVHAIDCEICLVEDEMTPRAINEADGVIFRVSPVTYQIYKYKIMPKLVPNKMILLAHVLDAFDKTISAQILEKAGVPTPKTYVSNKHSAICLTFPYIIKAAIGNQGTAVYLVENTNDVKHYREKVTQYHDTFVEQEYISESKGADKRVFVVGSNVVAAMRRNSTGGDFRANTHLGGRAQPYTPSRVEIRIALDAVTAHKLAYAGVDIIDSNNGPLVLEVNPSPGFKIATVTGIDVVEKIIDSLGVSND